MVVDDFCMVCQIEELTQNVNFERMEDTDIDELLNAEQNITNENLIEMDLNVTNTNEEEVIEKVPEGISTLNKFSKTMNVINKGLEILIEVDPDPAESSKISRKISDNLVRYKQMYLQKIRKPVQLTLEKCFVPVEQHQAIEYKSNSA